MALINSPYEKIHSSALTYVHTYVCMRGRPARMYVCMMEYYKVLSRKQFVSVSDVFFYNDKLT